MLLNQSWLRLFSCCRLINNFLLFFLFFLRVGVELPTIEVRYEHLSVEAEAYVGNRGLPTLFNSVINIVEVFFFKFSSFLLLIKILYDEILIKETIQY